MTTGRRLAAAARGWTCLANANDLTLTIRAADDGTTSASSPSESFLDPTALWLADAATGAVAKVKSLPAQFDASKDVVEQHFATSNGRDQDPLLPGPARRT